MLITTLVVSFLVYCRLEVSFSLQPEHYSSLTAPNLQPTAHQDRNDQWVNKQHSRELLMMGIVVPETCLSYKKYNKIISGIYLVFILQLLTSHLRLGLPSDSFPQVSSPKLYIHFSSPPYRLHGPPISFFSI